MKNIFVFPGQGAQSTEIIKSLKTYGEHYYKEDFQIISEAVGFDLEDFMSNAPMTELNRTEFTQIVMFAADIGYLSVIKGLGARADIVAGHSAGQYAALYEAGCFDLYDVSRIIKRRAALMSQISKEGCLCAVKSPVTINAEEIEYICELFSRKEKFYIDVALYNSDKQIVVGGTRAGVKKFMAFMEERRANCAVSVLPVGQAFHTKLMDEMIPEFAEHLNGITVREPKIPVILNGFGDYYNGSDLREELLNHCRSPVKWSKTIMRIFDIKDEKNIFEVGPGHTLSGFFRNMGANFNVTAAEDGRKVMNRVKKLQTILNAR
ncbi:MAG: ACP S-malonyltransferase [Clostridiales bacterium]|nr:ACP S-malonyltransferase [Clostridiales bacterium]